LAAFGLLAIGLAYWINTPWDTEYLILSGKLFSLPFLASDANFNYSLGNDPGRVKDYFVLFTFLTALVLPYIAAARWMSDPKSRLDYWVLLISAIMFVVWLSLFLIAACIMLGQYIATFGFTPKRLLGVAYGLVCVFALLAFVAWVARKPRGS